MDKLQNVPIADPHVSQAERLQIGDDRLSTSCGVVDHDCDDDLFLLRELPTLHSMAFEQCGMDVRDIQAAQFVMDERRRR